MACFQIQCILDDETNVTVSNVPYDMVHNASAVVLLLKSANAAMKSNFELAKLAVLHHNSDYTWQMATDHTIQDEMQWMRASGQDMPVLVLKLLPSAEVQFTCPNAPEKKKDPEPFLGMGQAQPTMLDYE